VVGVDKTTVTPLGEGWYLVDDGVIQTRVAVAIDESSTWVFVDGFVTQIKKEATSPGRDRSKGRGESGVMAPMPATVVSINTAAGQTVSEGETVIVLEAMKMELPIKSPRAGVVKAIHCAKGDLVQPGVSLLDIE
jgi:biotin carboxyl carrier protein